MDYPFTVVMTTCPNQEDTKKVTEALMRKKLAACIQRHDVQSTYWWEGEIETDCEVRLMIKTRESLFEEISAVIKAEVSYENPQIVSVPIVQGSQDYLNWIDSAIS